MLRSAMPHQCLEVAMDRHESLTVSVVNAAQLLGVSRALAYELVARGELPSLRLGRRVVIPRRALEALIEHATGGNGPGDDETHARRERASLRVSSASARGGSA
jgi:excisionase family DNA binding protein